jgi:hypothetical protein
MQSPHIAESTGVLGKFIVALDRDANRRGPESTDLTVGSIGNSSRHQIRHRFRCLDHVNNPVLLSALDGKRENFHLFIGGK